MPTIKKRDNNAKKLPNQEFMTIAHRITDFAITYKKQLLVVCLSVAAVFLIAAGYLVLRSVQEKNASPLVSAAYEYYRPSAGTAPDYQKALGLFRDVQQKYPSTVNGAIAQYYIGNCLANLGQTDEALKEYKKFISQYSGDKFLLGLVYQRVGYIYQGLNNQSEAIQAWEQAESLNGPGVSTIELAKLYEATGNIAEAQKKYKLVLSKLGGTTWAMEAMTKTQSAVPFSVPGAGKETK